MVIASSVGLDAFPFHVHWDIVGVAFGLVFGYVYGIRRLAARHAPASEPVVTRRQIGYFVAGITIFVGVEAWPIHDIGEGSLFTFHTIEHVALVLLVPPFLLKGTPWWLTRLVVAPVMGALRLLTKPIVALIAFNAVLAYMHAPAVIDLMLRNEFAHFVLHGSLIFTAFLMWWPVIGPIPDIDKLPPLLAMGYLFLQSLVPTIPASFLTFADSPVYAAYEALPRLWGLSVLDDQLIAGLLMKIGGGAILWTAITVIFFTWAVEEDRSTKRGVSRVSP